MTAAHGGPFFHIQACISAHSFILKWSFFRTFSLKISRDNNVHIQYWLIAKKVKKWHFPIELIHSFK